MTTPTPRPTPDAPTPAPTPGDRPINPAADRVVTALMDRGFVRNEELRTRLEADANAAGAGNGGKYTVLEAASLGDTVTLYVEQNIGSDDFGGLAAQVTYPAVAIIEGPGGRVAFDPANVALAERLATELG